MRTNNLPIKAFLGALAAAALFPVSPAAATLALTVAGLAALLLSDYGSTARPVAAVATVLPFTARRALAELDKAA